MGEIIHILLDSCCFVLYTQAAKLGEQNVFVYKPDFTANSTFGVQVADAT